MNSRAVFLVCIGLAGCSDMTSTQQRALSGTAIGAGTGAVLGAIGGNAGLGAIAGAGAGLAAGLIYDSVKKNQQAAYEQGYSAGAHSKPSQTQ
ncbi:MAG: glycine zipper family protein [Rhodopila sp.]|nr:glycine zipper family protein [Rhodopila sp.]